MIGKWMRGLYEFAVRVVLIGELFIALRILLKIFGANETTLVVRYLYKGTAFLIAPFQNIFPNQPVGRIGVLDLAAVTAGAGYAVAALVVLGVFQAFLKK